MILGAWRSRGWLGPGWLAEFAKNVGTKRSYTPPLGGEKTQAFLVAPQKDLLSVGWSFRISISTGEVKVQFQREKEGPDTVSEHHRCPKSVRYVEP